MAITPTAAQLSILELNVAMFGQAVGTTAMAAALPTFKDGNTYAQSLVTTSDAYKILSTEQAFTKVINNISAGTGVTATQVDALAKGLVPFVTAGLSVGAVINMLTVFLYQNAGKLTGDAAIWNNSGTQLVNKTTAAAYYTLDQNQAAASADAIAGVTYNNNTSPSGDYTGTANDDMITLQGGLSNTLKIDGGQQGANGDTLIISAAASATANNIDLTMFQDQNRTVNTQNVKVSPIIQGFENVDATAATTEMFIIGRDRTSEANTGSVAATQTGSVLQGGAYRDTINGSAGNDVISGNAGNDSLTAGAGNDTISGGTDNDTINAGAGDDVITDGAGQDTVSGGDGNDTITIGGGLDLINGDAGNDTITFEAAVVAGSSTARTSVYGGTGNDTINNTNAAATSFLTEFGNAGHDKFTLGLATETIAAGADNDIFVIAKANLSATDVLNGNDGCDAMQLLIPNGDATTTFELTPVNGQFKGFEVIELIDQSGNTNSKTYKINLTDDFVANNIVNGQLLIDARGLPAGSNLVVDTSALTALSAASFVAGKLQIWTSPSTDVKDQLLKKIDSNYLINASNAALNGVAAFYTNGTDTVNVAGVHDATTGLITTFPAGAAAYTVTGGVADTTSNSGTSGNTFVLSSNAAVIVPGANSGTTDSATNPTKGFTASQDIVNALMFLNGAAGYYQDATTGDADILNAILGVGASTAQIRGIETLNLTGAGSSLSLANVVGATAINLVTGNETLVAVGTTSPITLNNGFAGTALLQSANAGAAADFAVTLAGGSTTANLQFEDSAGAQLVAGSVVTATVSAATTLAQLWDDNAASAAAAKGDLVVKGSGNLTVTDLQFTTVTAASDYAGALNLTIKAASAAGGGNTIIGGAGNDTFDLTTTFAGASDAINGGAGNDTLKLNISAGAQTLTSVFNVENIVLTGTGALPTTIATNLGLGETLNIDGSALTGALNNTVNGGEIYKLNITGSATVANTLNGAGYNDTLTGGAGNDTFTGGTGNDVLTGGLGADAFNAGTVAATGSDWIKDFVAGTDKITTAMGALGAGFRDVGAISTATYASLDLALASIGNITQDEAVKFSYGSDTYVVVGVTATAAYTTGDVLVKLTGITGTMTVADFN